MNYYLDGVPVGLVKTANNPNTIKVINSSGEIRRYDKADYDRKRRKGGIIGSLIGTGVGVAAGALLRKPLEMKGLYSAGLMGSLGALTGGAFGQDIGRSNAKEV